MEFRGVFTTFSSFAVEAVRFAESGRHRRAAIYVAGISLAAPAAVGLGAAVGTAVA